jgi:hypothetical protein
MAQPFVGPGNQGLFDPPIFESTTFTFAGHLDSTGHDLVGQGTANVKWCNGCGTDPHESSRVSFGFEPAAVPEPSLWLLLLIPGLALFALGSGKVRALNSPRSRESEGLIYDGGK